jgi:hypothetical protein
MLVKELIAELQTMNPEATVAIDDADTGWLLDVLEVENYQDPDLEVIGLRGDYGSII